MKYGHWIRNVPEMYWFAYILQPSQDNYNINNNSHLQKQQNARIGYDMLRHFLERLPNVQFQTLMISREFFRQECFLDYLIERVLPMVRELILNDVMDIVDLRRVLSATANSLTCLHVKRCIIVCDMALGVVPTVDDIPFKAGLSSLTISIENNIKVLPVEFWAGFWRGCTSVASLTIDDVIPGLVEVLKQDVAEHLPNLHTLCLGHGSFERRTSEVLGFSDKDVAMLLRTSTLRELKLKVVQEPPRKGLVMTLKSVLARLSGLKKLEVLELYGFADHRIEHKDVEWMVKNWRQLRSIGGLPMFRPTVVTAHHRDQHHFADKALTCVSKTKVKEPHPFMIYSASFDSVLFKLIHN
ncbi:hypothetical protein BG005_001766 [Podila minutissima]|nr:hypothetical protein BG005_001766 [Podila minutissima]